ncbi:MAG: LacI family DNA-binding transcriptional regulator, partial [Casimicrobiaceae bacterium]
MVAKVARVSPITVSNVINGHFQSMSASTRKRVEKAITQLNYRVNLAARGLSWWWSSASRSAPTPSRTWRRSSSTKHASRCDS